MIYSSNEYLYGEGVTPPQFPRDIIVKRIELLEVHLAKLLEVDYKTRDTERVNKVAKAIKFWEQFLKENADG